LGSLGVNLDIVVFDKTGTLMRGSPAVSEIAAAPGTTEDDLIARAAAVEANSEHPLAKAIFTEAKRRDVTRLLAVTELHRRGLKVAMVTGDSKMVANSVARRIGIDEVTADVVPADKASAVKRFQAGGKKVAMVGDGVNDAPAGPQAAPRYMARGLTDAGLLHVGVRGPTDWSGSALDYLYRATINLA
jgi:cation transport ATPase